MLEELRKHVDSIVEVLKSCCSDDVNANSLILNLSWSLENFRKLVGEGREKAYFMLDSYGMLYSALRGVALYTPPNADLTAPANPKTMLMHLATEAQELATKIVLEVLK